MVVFFFGLKWNVHICISTVCSMALLAAGCLWDHLSAEVRHQRRAPGHRVPEHGRHGRRRAGEGSQDAVRRGDDDNGCY